MLVLTIRCNFWIICKYPYYSYFSDFNLNYDNTYAIGKGFCKAGK
jgi:hypothetical protein